ncbi:hypothetical protein D3C72_1787220 [compost metagenome]
MQKTSAQLKEWVVAGVYQATLRIWIAGMKAIASLTLVTGEFSSLREQDLLKSVLVFQNWLLELGKRMSKK